jgi:hypothetical protein
MKGSEEDSAAEFRSEVTGDGRFPVPVQIGATIVTIYDRRLLLTMFRDLGDRPTVI